MINHLTALYNSILYTSCLLSQLLKTRCPSWEAYVQISGFLTASPWNPVNEVPTHSLFLLWMEPL